MDKPSIPLISGLISSIAAGLCCTAPLVLISMGIGGAWISQLAELAPFRPLFIALAILSFAWAGWQLYRPFKYCRPAAVCSEPRAHRHRQVLFWLSAILAIALITSPWWIFPLLHGA